MDHATISTIREVIASTNELFMSVFNRGEAAQLATLYSEKAQLLPPNNGAIDGRAAIQAFWQGAMDMGIRGAKLETVDLEPHQDATYEVGNYLLTGAQGETLDRGKYIVIWKNDGGNWKLYRDIWNSSMPVILASETIQSTVASLIDQLPSEEKKMLQYAAVIGKDVPFALLADIAGKEKEELRLILMRLQGDDFLSKKRSLPNLEYSFKDAQTQEIGYNTISPDQRDTLHASILRAMERLFVEHPDEQVELLAYHAFQGKEWSKAVSYLRQAGAKAALHSDNRRAATYLEEALTAVQHLPDIHGALKLALRLRLTLHSVIFPLGEPERTLANLHHAETLAQNLKDLRLQAAVSMALGHYAWAAGNLEESLKCHERALAIATKLGDSNLQISVNFFLCQTFHARGDYRQAIEYSRRNVKALQGESIREFLGSPVLPYVSARTWLSWSLVETGEFVEGLQRAEEGLQVAEEIDQLFTLFHACWPVGALFLRKGELGQAISFLERSKNLCQIGDLPFMQAFADSYLGFAYVLAGRLDEGTQLIEQVVERSASMGIMFCHSMALGQLGEAYLLAERITDAIKTTERALHSSQKQKERGNEAWALRLLGEIFSHHDAIDAVKAENYYHQALALGEELGMRPLLAHCHFGLGKMYQLLEKPGEAQEHLNIAIRMFREMDMVLWLEKAESATLEKINAAK